MREDPYTQIYVLWRPYVSLKNLNVLLMMPKHHPLGHDVTLKGDFNFVNLNFEMLKDKREGWSP
jgi:hypothetical protein